MNQYNKVFFSRLVKCGLFLVVLSGVFMVMLPRVEAATLTAMFPNNSIAAPPTQANGPYIYAITSQGGVWTTFFGNYRPPSCPPATPTPSCPGGASGLDAIDSYYKVFRPTSSSGPFTGRLVGGCGNPGGGDKGNRRIVAQAYTTHPDGGPLGAAGPTSYNYGVPAVPGTGCNGNDLLVPIPDGAFTLNQSKRYLNAWETALIRVRKVGCTFQGGLGWQSIPAGATCNGEAADKLLN